MLGGRVRWFCGLAMMLAVAVAGPASAQTAAEADKLNAEVVRLYQAGKFAEAIPLAQRALRIREKALGPEHPDVGQSLSNLASVYRALGRYGEAEPLYRRGLAIREAALGPGHSDVATSLNALALLYRVQGRYAEAEPLYMRSLAIRERALGAEHHDVAQSCHNLAVLHEEQGRHREAEAYYLRSLTIWEKTLGPGDPNVAVALNGLARLYRLQGRYADAEPLAKRGLALTEAALGPSHPDVATSLEALALLYRAQGRYAEAEPLYERSLAVRETTLGPQHVDVAASLSNLAELYWATGRLAEAEPLYKRSLAIIETALGPHHQSAGKLLSNLSELYRAMSRYSEAEPLAMRSLANREKALGEAHADVGTALNNLALVHHALGRHALAEPLLMRSRMVFETALGPDHPAVANAFNNLAWLALGQRDWSRAARYWQTGAAVVMRRAERGVADASDGSSRSEAERSGWYFSGLVKATHRVTGAARETALRAREMFEMAQWGHTSRAAASLAQMAARSAAGSPAVAAIVRERQDLVAEWQIKDQRLIAAKSSPPAGRNAAHEQVLSARLAAIDRRLSAIDGQLAKDFPDYAALASPRPVSVAEVQASLRHDEVLVLFLDTVELTPLPEETFVWLVTKTAVHWRRAPLGTAGLAREIAALRCGLDAAAWWVRDSACPRITRASYSEQDQATGKPPPFDATRAHALYEALLGWAAGILTGKHVLLVPSGPLTTLPFQVLVTQAPRSADLASASWLIHEHALTVLPSVAALKSLRRTGKPSAAERPMLGFANPLLDGDQKHPKHGGWYKQQAERARAETGCAATPKQRTAALRAISRSANPVPQAAGLADLAHVKAQTPLPETADEVCEVARSVGADVADMRIGARATETELKRLSDAGDLVRYRILHFATHGLLGGQLSGTREPGLILTPPAKATPQDDGYLSGSDIAGLKLDADWVILSACNTAGGAGNGEAAEALSGLARVFFYAGARALLVSHWEVDSHSAVKLVTGAIGALAKDKSIGRAEAMRRAMLAAMADTTRPAGWVPAWHPSVWAPFVVVGEGGSGR